MVLTIKISNNSDVVDASISQGTFFIIAFC
jgi:hypothetical protein